MVKRKKITRKVTKRAAAPARSEVAPQGRRFGDAQKKHALVLVASGMSRVQVAATIGTTTESLRRWVREAKTAGTMPAPPVAKRASAPLAQQASRPAREKSPYAPADPAQGLSDPEVAAILEWKKKHPSMGPAQLRAQLKRFMGWRLSIKAIARVLRGHGYALVHTEARPVGPEPVRFEAPRRNALWQADFCEVRVGDERLHSIPSATGVLPHPPSTRYARSRRSRWRTSRRRQTDVSVGDTGPSRRQGRHSRSWLNRG
jgi:transposase